MTLGEKQRLFVKLLGKLFTWAYENGYELTLGEATRTKEQAEIYAAKGTGLKNSNHLIRLAIDLNLFIGGEYRTDSESYRPLGDYWISLDPLCAWGGHFSKPDGNHFSLEHNGVR
jgi:hypothetical protein